MASLNKSHLFKALQLQILEEIKKDKKIKKHYRHPCGKRTANVLVTTCCSLTCCLPCIVWDTCCACLSCFCKSNPARYGVGYMFIDKMCSSTFEDTRQQTLEFIKRPDITKEDFSAILNTYMTEFDKCVLNKQAKEANIIREHVVYLIRYYHPQFKYFNLKDDGNIIYLKQIIYDLDN